MAKFRNACVTVCLAIATSMRGRANAKCLARSAPPPLAERRPDDQVNSSQGKDNSRRPEIGDHRGKSSRTNHQDADDEQSRSTFLYQLAAAGFALHRACSIRLYPGLFRANSLSTSRSFSLNSPGFSIMGK